MTLPPNPSENDPPNDDASNEEKNPLDETVDAEDLANLMESTVDSIEEVLGEQPRITGGKHQESHGDSISGRETVGETTLPFGIDLSQTVDPSQLDSTHRIESMAAASNQNESSDIDQTIRLEDTADQNTIDATLQIDRDRTDDKVSAATPTVTGGLGTVKINESRGEISRDLDGGAIGKSTSPIDQNDIGQTVNPRELSQKDAAFWGSLLQSGTGKSANRGEATKVTPAIERTISETKLQIRVRDMSTPKQPDNTESDYRLVRLLGKGGMGNVFVAKQSSLDRLIAVKVIKPLEKSRRDKLAKEGRLDEVEEDRRQQFLSEAVVTGDLDHPNIVPIHDIAVTADNTLFYAMKRVVGTPWSKVIDEKNRDENLDILLKTADAIGFAHTRGVVHRDIKPENIMLGDFGVVLVMDWGLALAQPEFEKIDSISHTAGLGGTPAFMAPEMATGPMEKIGPGSDIYLLGATLFLIITGRPPHQAPNITQCIRAVAKNEITGDIASYSGELMNIALKAMAKEPSDRYADVREFQQAIREYRAHAESIALASRADQDAQAGIEQNDYTLFSRATYGYEQAISLWQGNKPAEEGLRSNKLAHAQAALENEDFDLGLSLLTPDNAEQHELIESLRHGQRERDLRQSRLTLFKLVAVGMLAFILVGGTIAFYFINDQRSKAIAASVIATKQTLLANAATRSVEREKDNVEAQRTIAEQKTNEAKENLIVAQRQTEEAKKQRGEADRQRAEAVKSGEAAQRSAMVAKEKEREARESETKAAQQEAIAILKAEEALREKEKAEYEVYLSHIGLAKARIERNEFDDARRILRDAKSRRGVTRLGWEWRWLWRQANQSVAESQTEASIVDLSLNEDGDRGVAVLENGAVDLIAVGQNGSIKKRRAERIDSDAGQHAKATTAAISSDGQIIAIGFQSGEIELWDAAMKLRSGALIGHKQSVTDLHFAGNERLVSASLDRTARIWNTRRKTLDATLWHIAAVRKLALVADDGQLLVATAVADRTSGRAVLWRASLGNGKVTPERLGEFSQHNRPLAAIALSPDGLLTATGDIDGNVFLWRTNGVQKTDYQNAVIGAIQKVGGKARVAASESRSANKFARLIDPKLSANVLDDVEPRLVSAPLRRSRATQAHSDLVESLAFSRDGQSLLSTAHDYTIKIWNVDTRTLGKTLRGHGGWVTSARFAGEDDQRVISVSKDATIRSWHIDQYGEELTLVKSKPSVLVSAESTAKPHADEIWSARFDPSGKRVVSASRDHTARVLQIDPASLKFREITSLDVHDDDATGDQLSEGTAFRAMSVAVDRANGHLFVGSADATVRVWDLLSGTQLGALNGTGLNRSVALSANGRLVLTGSSSPKAKAILWGVDPSRTNAPQVIHRLGGHEEAVTALAISPDGRVLFTGDRIGIGYFWDTATGKRKPQRIEDSRGFRINDAAFSPDGKELLFVSDDQHLTRIDVATGTRLARLSHDGFVTQISLSGDGRRALTVSEFNTKQEFRSLVTLWDLQRGSRRVIDRISSSKSDESTNNKSPIQRFLSARFGTQNDRLIISRAGATGQANRLSVVDIDSGETGEPRVLQLPRRLGPAEVALPLPGDHLLTLNGDAAFLWDLATMTHRKSYRAHAAITQASFSFDGKYIATGSRSLKIWDAETGKAVGKLESPHRGAVRSVQFSSHGPNYQLATAGEDGLARVWQWAPQTQSFTQLHERKLSNVSAAAARTVCFSDDGEWLLVAGDGGHAKAFALNEKNKAISLDQPLPISFNCADISRDGKWVVLGSDDKKARLFELDFATLTVSEPIVVQGHADQIEDVAIIQDGSKEMRVLTASQDKSARLWDPRIGTEQKQAREMLTLRRHSLGVTAVDVTRDGNLVLTASRDGSVILWPATSIDSMNLFDGLADE